MALVTRLLEFDAGHRVLGHLGKCQHLHGHRYKVEVTVFTPKLDSLDMVVDFGVIREKVGKWIDENLDHNLLLNGNDPLVGTIHWKENGRAPFIMDGNPTAENIADLLLGKARELLEGGSLRAVGVKVWETPNCCAEVRA